ncbi:aquaporin-11 [Pristis pectinata]|uniref:aquaporin-11 n=1 Tax=Pristis pectinata TaxID=685728 RepID=UPI00223DF2BA|nr:aquaporin-11 [Pristis pectinata]
MDDVLVSLGTVAGTVTVCQALRRMAREMLQPPCPPPQVGRGGQTQAPLLELATELFSTLQLCLCTHELRLLGLSGVMPGWGPALVLVYLITLVHISTFGSASCNPVSSLEQFLCGHCSGQLALFKVLVQLAAAAVAHSLSEVIWALHLSDLHLHHSQSQHKCTSALNTSTLSSGMLVEFACAFSLRAVIFRFQHLAPTPKMHLVVGIITFLVFAAGDLTGAVFNPALAYSVTFNCEGNTFLEYALVYWLGPLLGALTAVVLLDKNTAYCTSIAVQTQKPTEKED